MQHRHIPIIAGHCGETPVHRLSARAARHWRAWLVWWRTRQTVRALQGLSDRSLKDIGLTRGQIESVSLERARHELCRRC